jgi:hypothetical protein
MGLPSDQYYVPKTGWSLPKTEWSPNKLYSRSLGRMAAEVGPSSGAEFRQPRAWDTPSVQVRVCVQGVIVRCDLPFAPDCTDFFPPLQTSHGAVSLVFNFSLNDRTTRNSRFRQTRKLGGIVSRPSIIIIKTFPSSGHRGVAGYTEAHACPCQPYQPVLSDP